MCYSIYNAPQYPLAGGEGASCPRPQNCTPAIEHFGLKLRPYWPGKSFSTAQSMIFIVVTRYTDKMKRSLQKYDVALKDLRFALISRFRLITTAFADCFIIFIFRQQARFPNNWRFDLRSAHLHRLVVNMKIVGAERRGFEEKNVENYELRSCICDANDILKIISLVHSTRTEPTSSSQREKFPTGLFTLALAGHATKNVEDLSRDIIGILRHSFIMHLSCL